jgi:hypothetical protein
VGVRVFAGTIETRKTVGICEAIVRDNKIPVESDHKLQSLEATVGIAYGGVLGILGDGVLLVGAAGANNWTLGMATGGCAGEGERRCFRSWLQRRVTIISDGDGERLEDSRRYNRDWRSKERRLNRCTHRHSGRNSSRHAVGITVGEYSSRGDRSRRRS